MSNDETYMIIEPRSGIIDTKKIFTNTGSWHFDFRSELLKSRWWGNTSGAELPFPTKLDPDKPLVRQTMSPGPLAIYSGARSRILFSVTAPAPAALCFVPMPTLEEAGGPMIWLPVAFQTACRAQMWPSTSSSGK
jgi:hypothetical protein